MSDKNKTLREYYKGVEKFRREIYAIPSKVEQSNPTINFNSDLNHHESIIIDINGISTTLADSFFLFSEEVENNIIKQLQRQNDELVARVARLEGFTRDMAERYPLSRWISGPAEELLNETKSQSLQHIQAEAIENFRQCATPTVINGKAEYVHVSEIEKHISSLRQQQTGSDGDE